MDIINSEERLLSQIRVLQDNELGWSAFILSLNHPSSDNFGKTEIFQAIIQNTFEKEINQGEPPRVFILINNALIVIKKGAQKEEMDKASKEISFALHEELHTSESSECAYYDLSINWEKFKQACYKEISECRNRRKEAESDTEEVSCDVEQLRRSLDEFAHTLPSKRKKRKMPMVQFVEDDPAIAYLLNNLLGTRTLHGSITSLDGIQAVQDYFSHAPDVLFLDIGLPKLSGLEALKLITSIDNNSFIVMLTADGSHKTVKECIEIGAKGYITKPFTKGKLDEYLNKYDIWKSHS